MDNRVYRIFTEKKPEYDNESGNILHDLTSVLHISGIERLRVFHRYDIQGISEEDYQKSRFSVFAEPPLDFIYDEALPAGMEASDKKKQIFGWEYLPGQYDQRADSAAQAIQILTQGEKPVIRYASILVFYGKISAPAIEKIKKFIINPVDSRETRLSKPSTLIENRDQPDDIPVIKGFITMDNSALEKFIAGTGLAMDLNDLIFLQSYFKNDEKRDPTMTEIRIIDTYWSDHCRHTTFLTEIDEVEFEEGPFKSSIESTYYEYLESRRFLSTDQNGKKISLMDLATISMRELKAKGYLSDLDESDEINACSIVVPVEGGTGSEEWLVMFKNETHNHPTEIEPFGGAATCVGGAIRDPLSGRSYVYQAMRVTGSGNPMKNASDTLQGKLPQRKITVEAAHGFSSYGNQIGLATGQVSEIYHEGYVAKRMEIGAVVGAVRRSAVKRSSPVKGDVVILLGGRTGRDGCGGATGSSKSHTEESIFKAGAEVQKGNAPEERKIQRLFRKPEVSVLIKKCNDFGAGGISVAIGEIADGLLINLDKVPKKYEDLDGTELAISESQERMAVLVDSNNAGIFIESASKENLEATVVAEVIEEKRVKMTWRGKLIVNISRDFLNSSGPKRHARVNVKSPDKNSSPFIKSGIKTAGNNLEEAWIYSLSNLNSSSQKGLVERFDSTIGALTVTMPFGGRKSLTPAQSMCSKLPVTDYETTTGTVMSWGFDAEISEWSPYHGGIYAVVDSIAKAAAAGADYRKIRLTLQEYFEKLFDIPEKWGKPFSSLLGAYKVQKELLIPAIGGKDSMSGTFNNLNVPPTLVSFALSPVDITGIITPEFKNPNNNVYLLQMRKNEFFIPDWAYFKKLCERLFYLIDNKKIISVQTVRAFGVSEAISKMCFGNMIGFEMTGKPAPGMLFGQGYGSFVIEGGSLDEEDLSGLDHILLGRTIPESEIRIENTVINLSVLIDRWMEPLSEIFPVKTPDSKIALDDYSYCADYPLIHKGKSVKPLVLIPVFPGTNCEYDSVNAFEKAGAKTETFIFRNRTPEDVNQSISSLASAVSRAQMLMLPGGFSAGDEPEGSGKFIAAVFRSPKIRDAVMDLLKVKDGLILGICNGFQALIKLGLVPYGEIRDLDIDSPTLTYNKIGRHVSSMVRTKIVSTLSPWFMESKIGDMHILPVSHGEGRFIAPSGVLDELKKNGQIATRYVDENGNATMNMPSNPNGSDFAIEGITSADGRIFGKMAHSERTGPFIGVNIPGNKFQPIFKAGVKYFL